MFFATPAIRRHVFSAPQAADLALQRFLQASVTAPRSAGCQVSHSDNATTLTLDVPGLNRDQLELRLDGAQVQLTSVEGAPRQVRRSWELAHEIDASASSAKLENGVLTLVLAKRQPVDTSSLLSID